MARHQPPSPIAERRRAWLVSDYRWYIDPLAKNQGAHHHRDARPQTAPAVGSQNARPADNVCSTAPDHSPKRFAAGVFAEHGFGIDGAETENRHRKIPRGLTSARAIEEEG